MKEAEKDEVVVTGEIVSQKPKSKNGNSTSVKIFTRSQHVQLGIKHTVDAEVFPKTLYKKKEKHHDPAKGKEKTKLAEFIGEEVMSF